jgi:hypothetical protein
MTTDPAPPIPKWEFPRSARSAPMLCASEPQEFIRQARQLFAGLDRTGDLVRANDHPHKGLAGPLDRIEDIFLARSRFD